MLFFLFVCFREKKRGNYTYHAIDILAYEIIDENKCHDTCECEEFFLASHFRPT